MIRVDNGIERLFTKHFKHLTRGPATYHQDDSTSIWFILPRIANYSEMSRYDVRDHLTCFVSRELHSLLA